MSFLGRILRFLLWALVAWWAAKLLRGAIGGANAPQTTSRDAGTEPLRSAKRLVKDPVCGMHIAEELALPLKAGGEVLHFCSQECRAKYENSVMRRAASA